MSPPPPPPPADTGPQHLQQAIAALVAQRDLLGDTVTELALAPLRQLLAAAVAAPKLRRAQVTVLFADIVGSTALAGRLDAEDTLELFGSVLQRAADCVRGHGGRVLRFTGDGLKAAFGTQGAHEDDAVRAVQAGLEILAVGRGPALQLQQRLNPHDFVLRVRVHTGEVAFGAGIEADNTLTGDAVNVAARMEQSAPPGGLRISADTWAQVRGRFIADEQPPLQLKGLDKPLLTWLVHAPIAPQASAAGRGVEGLRVAMVGRDAELACLRQTIVAVTATATANATATISRSGSASPSLQAVTVVAAAGLGKTRLLREVLDGGAARGLRLLRARAQPRDSLRAWSLLNQLVAGHCGITDGDSADAARAKLLSGLTPSFSGEAPADAERQAQLIGQLIGLDFSDAPGLRSLDARALRDLALAAVLAWLGGLCRQVQPTADDAGSGAPVPVLVLAIEDLHWADEASLDLLQHLMTQGRHLRLALLMNSRPDLLERRPAWCDGETGTRITLAPLTAADGDALATALLQRLAAVPTALHGLLTGRAEGNPYYMEELLRRLLDDGVIRQRGAQWQVDEQRLTQLRLPTTLVGLLQARLDALPEAERDGAQRASIVGHVFWDAALAQIDPAAPTALAGLQRRGWLQAHQSSAFDDTAERQFDHHLLHQVTYETVLKAERRRGHAAVARWLAERTAGRGPEFLAITGEHAERAGDDALAIDCYERAAAEAQQRFANTLAVDCLQRALKLMAAADVKPRLRLLNTLRGLADLTGNRELQRHTIDDTLSLLAAHPDPHALAELTMARAMLADGQGRLDDGFALARDALAQAVAISNDGVAAWAHGYLCERLGRRGDYGASRAHQVAGQAHAERVRDTQPIRALQLLVMAGIVALQAEQLSEAGALLNRAMTGAETCEGSRFRRLQLGALNALCVHAQCLGDWAAAADLSRRLAQQSRDMGDIRRLGVALHNAALVDLAQGQPQRALTTLEQAVASYQASGDLFHPAYSHAAAGDAHVQLGDAQAARNAYDQARSLFARFAPDGPNAAEMDALVARQDLALGDDAAARAGAERAEATLRPGSPVSAADHGFASRWACVEVWSGLSDPRAAGRLAQLQASVREVSLQRTGSPDGALQLQQRIPIFRAIMAANGGLTTSAAAS
jgi:class 3 adenylate cyclase/tetratricopeptide (TPR) repeat protein